MLPGKGQSKHVTPLLRTLKDIHPNTFKIKSRLPPITHKGQHDLITVSDLIPDVLPTPLQLILLYTPGLGLSGPQGLHTCCSRCLEHCSPLRLPLAWLFSSNRFLLKWHLLREAFSGHKNLKISLHPPSFSSPFPAFIFIIGLSTVWKCIIY